MSIMKKPLTPNSRLPNISFVSLGIRNKKTVMTDNEKKIIDKLIKDIKSLELAINSPTYPDTPHTRSSLIKLKGKLDILKKAPKFKDYIESQITK
jgi:hypothetical protein